MTVTLFRVSALIAGRIAPKRRAALGRAVAVVVLGGLLAGCLRAGPMLGPVDEMLPDLPDSCGLAALSDLRGQPMERLADFRLIGPLRVLWRGKRLQMTLCPPG